MPPDAPVLTTEFKINLLAPSKGERLRAIGRVVRAGKKLVMRSAKCLPKKAEPANRSRSSPRP